MKLNENGMSLVNVMVGFALLGVLSIGVMRVMKNMSSGKVSMDSSFDHYSMRRDIAMILDDKRFCRVSLAHKGPDGTTPAKTVSGTDLSEVAFFKKDHDGIGELDPGIVVDLWLSDVKGEKQTLKKFNDEANPGSDDKSQYGNIKVKSMKLIFPNDPGTTDKNYPLMSFFNDQAILRVHINKRVGINTDQESFFEEAVMVSGFTDNNGRSVLMGCEQITLQEYPMGSICGMNVVNQGYQRIKVSCIGHDPLISCPAGFSKQNFGYYEAGDGARHAYYCMRTSF